MATWNNSEITISGSQFLIEKIESQLIVASNGNATYVDVTFNVNVNIPVTRYYFNSNNTLYISLGDIGRALVASGVTGSVVVCSVKDDYDTTQVNVTQQVMKGTSTLISNNQIPQREQLDLGSATVPYFFYFIDFGSRTYEVQKSYDNGATWNLQNTYTVLGGEPLFFNFNYSNVGDLARVVDVTGGGSVEVWRCSKANAENGCNFEAVGFNWECDYGEQKFGWAEIIGVERKVESVAVANNEGWINDATFKNLKSFTLQLKCVAKGLTKEEVCYFDDLFTSNNVTLVSCTETILLSYLQIYGALTDISIKVNGDTKRVITNERTNLEFTLEILKVKSL